MYTVDDKDEVVELADVPQSSIGAPLPIVVSDEFTLLLAYIVERVDPDWDGTYVRVVNSDTPGETVAVVRFQRCYASMFGPPNDESFHGHPLASRGLGPYMAAEVMHSSWLRRLERMNSVHEHHEPERFQRYHHFVFAFHDSTFECIADGFSISLHQGTMKSVKGEMVNMID